MLRPVSQQGQGCTLRRFQVPLALKRFRLLLGFEPLKVRPAVHFGADVYNANHIPAAVFVRVDGRSSFSKRKHQLHIPNSKPPLSSDSQRRQEKKLDPTSKRVEWTGSADDEVAAGNFHLP